MDVEMLRTALSSIPFNGHLGLEIVGLVGDKGVVRLPDSEPLRNHVGSQHAGALFAAAEAASGAAVLGALGARLAEVTPLAKGAEIQYLKMARGVITATASLGEDKAAILSRLDADGKVLTDVRVEMTDAEGVVVATMTVHWHMRKRA
jgi:acyl-coenzyme A thioesterase PaaI-like protein